MNYSTNDGFPITFSLNDAARITGISVPRLRNYVARDKLKHVGQVPLAGQERRFSASGLVEISMLDALAGFGLETASRVTEATISNAYAVAFLTYCAEHPEHGWNRTVMSNPNEEINRHMDFHPNDWLRIGGWKCRDLEVPALLVFAIDGDNGHILGPELVRGFDAIPQGRIDALKAHFEAWHEAIHGKDVAMRPIEELASDWPLFHVLNVTAIMRRIDSGIKEVIKARQPFRREEAIAVGLTSGEMNS